MDSTNKRINMKQVNINGDLIYISDAEYEEMEKEIKNEVQKKVRIKDKTEKANRKSRTKPEREE